MPEDFFEENDRRMPTVYRKIEDIDPDEDIRVSIIGTIVDKDEYTLIVDDGTGNLEVEFDEQEKIEGLESGNKVRVIGRPTENLFYGEFVQDFTDLDVNLFEKAQKKLDKIR